MADTWDQARTVNLIRWHVAFWERVAGHRSAGPAARYARQEAERYRRTLAALTGGACPVDRPPAAGG